MNTRRRTKAMDVTQDPVGDHRRRRERSEEFHRWFHWLSRIAILVVVVRVLHVVLPFSWHWLSSEHLQQIDSIVPYAIVCRLASLMANEALGQHGK